MDTFALLAIHEWAKAAKLQHKNFIDTVNAMLGKSQEIVETTNKKHISKLRRGEKDKAYAEILSYMKQVQTLCRQKTMQKENIHFKCHFCLSW